MRRKQNFIVVLILLILLLNGCRDNIEMKLRTDIERGDEGCIGLSVYGKDGEEIIRDIFVNYDYRGEEDISVADLLIDMGRELKIPVSFKVSFMGIYIEGINGLFEFDNGAESGWIYFVNSKSPGIGCDSYILQDGDYVEWRYTMDFGKDIGAYSLTE